MIPSEASGSVVLKLFDVVNSSNSKGTSSELSKFTTSWSSNSSMSFSKGSSAVSFSIGNISLSLFSGLGHVRKAP